MTIIIVGKMNLRIFLALLSGSKALEPILSCVDLMNIMFTHVSQLMPTVFLFKAQTSVSQ